MNIRGAPDSGVVNIREWGRSMSARREPGGKAPPGSVYIKAGYSERGEAKRLGARWDKSAAGKAQARKFWPHDKRAAGCWFVPPGNDLTEFRQLWELSDNNDAVVAQALEKLEGLGLAAVSSS